MDQVCGSCRVRKDVEEFSPSYRGRSGTWCRACFAAHKRGERGTTAEHQPLICHGCGANYVPKNLKRTARYCSRSCKERAASRERQAAIDAAKPERECLHCAKALPRKMRSDARFCSKRCNEAAHALQRKLRARVGQDEKPGYLRAAICVRDGWTCGICSRSVDSDREYPDPLAASLDHVVPVSQGGTNDPANLRLVHLVCNLRRRHLGGGEQLALI